MSVVHATDLMKLNDLADDCERLNRFFCPLQLDAVSKSTQESRSEPGRTCPDSGRSPVIGIGDLGNAGFVGYFPDRANYPSISSTAQSNSEEISDPRHIGIFRSITRTFAGSKSAMIFSRIALGFLLIGLPLRVYCQDNDLSRNRLTVDSLNALGEEMMRSRGFREAEKILMNSLSRSEAIRYPVGEGTAYLNLCWISYLDRNFDRADEFGRKAIGIFHSVGEKHLLAKAYEQWGTSVWAQSRFADAVSSFEKARELYEADKDSAGLGSSNALLALAEEERGNYEKSFQYSVQALQYGEMRANTAIGQLYADVGDYDEALDYYRKDDNHELMVFNYLKIGEAFYLKKDYDSALYFYARFIDESNGPGEKVNSKPYELIGEVYLAQKQYDKALYYFQSALAEFREVNDRNWMMRALLQLGKAYKELDRPDRALVFTRELLTMSKQSGAMQYQRDAHFQLYEIFDELKRTDSAYVNLKKYTALNTIINLELSARKLAFFNASSELQQAKLKIDLLDRQQQLQQSNIDRERQQKWILISFIGVLIVVSSILVRNFFLKKKNAEHLQRLSENELQIEKLQHSKKLGELEMQVLRTQMNPHFIFNSLSSINRFILRNSKSEASAYLTKLSRLVRMILQNSLSELISLEEEIDSLKLYLELESLRFDNQFTYGIVIEDSVHVSMTKVPPLIIQPFVENAIWHGLMPKEAPGKVEVFISIEGQYLLIKISDDGVGRAFSATKKGMEVTPHRSLGMNITSQRVGMMQHDKSIINSVVVNDLVDGEGLPIGTEVTIKLPVVS